MEERVRAALRLRPVDRAAERSLRVEGDEVIVKARGGNGQLSHRLDKTGTGKTHTMMGDIGEGGLGDRAGIIPRAAAALFETLGAGAAAMSIVRSTVHCSYMQIYGDRVMDMLADGRSGSLAVRETPFSGARGSSKSIFVQGLSEYQVTSAGDVLSLVARGDAARATRATDHNAQSSRSHAILQLALEVESVETGDDAKQSWRSQFADGGDAAPPSADGGAARTVIRRAKLSLVDLAGSEKWSDSATHDKALASELRAINKSLSALGNCIAALADLATQQQGAAQAEGGRVQSRGSLRSHVPYRDSALTRLLQARRRHAGRRHRDGVGRRERADETNSTLAFARATRVTATLRFDEVVNDGLLKGPAEISRLRRQLQRYQTSTPSPLSSPPAPLLARTCPPGVAADRAERRAEAAEARVALLEDRHAAQAAAFDGAARPSPRRGGGASPGASSPRGCLPSRRRGLRRARRPRTRRRSAENRRRRRPRRGAVRASPSRRRRQARRAAAPRDGLPPAALDRPAPRPRRPSPRRPRPRRTARPCRRPTTTTPARGRSPPRDRVPDGRMADASAAKLAALLLEYEADGMSLEACFDAIDADGSGLITAQELWDGLTSLGDAFEDLTRADVWRVIFSIDEDKNGSIDKAELAAFVARFRAGPAFADLTVADAWRLVRTIDLDRNGSVDLPELEAFVAKPGGAERPRRRRAHAGDDGGDAPYDFDFESEHSKGFASPRPKGVGFAGLGDDAPESPARRVGFADDAPSRSVASASGAGEAWAADEAAPRKAVGFAGVDVDDAPRKPRRRAGTPRRAPEPSGPVQPPAGAGRRGAPKRSVGFALPDGGGEPKPRLRPATPKRRAPGARRRPAEPRWRLGTPRGVPFGADPFGGGDDDDDDGDGVDDDVPFEESALWPPSSAAPSEPRPVDEELDAGRRATTRTTSSSTRARYEASAASPKAAASPPSPEEPRSERRPRTPVGDGSPGAGPRQARRAVARLRRERRERPARRDAVAGARAAARRAPEGARRAAAAETPPPPTATPPAAETPPPPTASPPPTGPPQPLPPTWGAQAAAARAPPPGAVCNRHGLKDCFLCSLQLGGAKGGFSPPRDRARAAPAGAPCARSAASRLRAGPGLQARAGGPGAAAGPVAARARHGLASCFLCSLQKHGVGHALAPPRRRPRAAAAGRARGLPGRRAAGPVPDAYGNASPSPTLPRPPVQAQPLATPQPPRPVPAADAPASRSPKKRAARRAKGPKPAAKGLGGAGGRPKPRASNPYAAGARGRKRGEPAKALRLKRALTFEEQTLGSTDEEITPPNAPRREPPPPAKADEPARIRRPPRPMRPIHLFWFPP
ncbi:hypothetical protein JL721_5456 [Aureococcus anophagefferens]|nr:hypothetical protein JL721_5456 [Aureococcus anophagefferens]